MRLACKHAGRKGYGLFGETPSKKIMAVRKGVKRFFANKMTRQANLS